MDLALRVGTRNLLCVEAKREGIPFLLPNPVTQKSYQLDGAILTDTAIKEAIEQVRQYCDDQGIRYAVATNGYTWIIFRAIREDMPWRKGRARIFPSLEHIAENFTEFWNLLSYPSIQSGSLDEEFGPPKRTQRRLDRVIDDLFNADLPLQRNRLHAQLDPLIRAFFDSIADQDALEILESCYVHSASLRIVARDLDLVITDSPPKFLRNEGVDSVGPGSRDSPRFDDRVQAAINSTSGELFLILGGIGSGKTTFLKRYQRSSGKAILESKSVWFHIDFLQAPMDPGDLEAFVWRSVLDQLRIRYTTPHLETRRDIKRIFKHDIDAITETALQHTEKGSKEFERELSPYLERWQSDLSRYVPGLLAQCKTRRKIGVVVFIDNVDQLSAQQQAQVFLLAQRVTRMTGSVSIVALREESYYTASVQRTFTAYTNRKFHLASPRFRVLIGNRISFAIDVLQRSEDQLNVILPTGVELDRDAIGNFLQIVQHSIFERNRNIARFIESICFGNMRSALQMFSTFLTSGATDVDKMLHIYRRDGAYYVAYHEFVRSIMLGDRLYYKEEQSPIYNVLDCGADRNASHFTSLRILRYLVPRRREYTPEGQGYVELSEIITVFEDVFDNRADVIRSLNRLVARQLVEVNTKSTETIGGASHVRLTSAGLYYLTTLVQSFCYLDLVLQDTPINDLQTLTALRGSVSRVGNLADWDSKVERMEVRFNRVAAFLDYLTGEESLESPQDEMTDSRGLREPFLEAIRKSFESQRDFILKRLQENRERFAEENWQDKGDTDDLYDDTIEDLDAAR